MTIMPRVAQPDFFTPTTGGDFEWELHKSHEVCGGSCGSMNFTRQARRTGPTVFVSRVPNGREKMKQLVCSGLVSVWFGF